MKGKFKGYLAIAIALFTVSCNTSEEEKKSLLPNSTGELAEIVVLSDKATLDSAFKLEIESVFSKALEGQPPPGEAVFKVVFADETFFGGYYEKHHNLFILLTSQNAARLKKVLPKKWVDGLLNTKQQKPGIVGVKQEDIFAKNQNVFVILANDKTTLNNKLKAKKDDLLNIGVQHENASGKRKLLGTAKASADKFYQKCLTDRGFGVRLPQTYRVAKDVADFVWIRKQITKEEKEMSILLFEAPYTSTQDLTTDSLLAIRNRYAKKYIPGEIDGSYMKYSSALPPVRTDQNFKEKYGVEIRGWWDVQGDFMGGPSYIRAVVDEANGRIVFAEGFLFYPNEKKAKSMRELEILVNTLSIK